MKHNPDCIFCQIASKEIESNIFWESSTHVAILSIFPNTEGFSVAFPKRHLPSYVLALGDEDLCQLAIAAKQAGTLLDNAFDDVGRTAVIFEGFGVDHAHAKLFPMHGTPKSGPWQKISSTERKYFSAYEGYVASNDGEPADPSHLKHLCALILKRNDHFLKTAAGGGFKAN